MIWDKPVGEGIDWDGRAETDIYYDNGVSTAANGKLLATKGEFAVVSEFRKDCRYQDKYERGQFVTKIDGADVDAVMEAMAKALSDDPDYAAQTHAVDRSKDQFSFTVFSRNPIEAAKLHEQMAGFFEKVAQQTDSKITIAPNQRPNGQAIIDGSAYSDPETPAIIEQEQILTVG